jgi:hypothetical protein
VCWAASTVDRWAARKVGHLAGMTAAHLVGDLVVYLAEPWGFPMAELRAVQRAAPKV